MGNYAALDTGTHQNGEACGYDAGNRVKDRKRKALVDKDGCALVLDPQPADAKDYDSVVLVLRLSRLTFLFIIKAFAAAGYGDCTATATIRAAEIVSKPSG